MENISPEVQAPVTQPVSVQLVSAVPAWARGFGVLALVGAILAFLVPFIGPLFLTIPTALLTAVALYGGDKKLGTIAFCILAINLVVSPSVWVSLFGGALTDGGPGAGVWVPIIGIISVLGLIPLLFRK